MEDSTGPESARRRRGRRGPGGRLLWVLLFLLVAAGGVVLAVWWSLAPRSAPEAVRVAVAPESAAEVTLFFADPRWTQLVAEPRRIRASSDPVDAIRALVDALVEGPRGDGAPVLPASVRLQGVYLGSDGLAVVDFDPAIDAFDPGGVSGELLAVFALVHTLAENVPEVRSLQILVGGEARETLAGHVKISQPLAPDARWTSGRTP